MTVPVHPSYFYFPSRSFGFLDLLFVKYGVSKSENWAYLSARLHTSARWTTGKELSNLWHESNASPWFLSLSGQDFTSPRSTSTACRSKARTGSSRRERCPVTSIFETAATTFFDPVQFVSVVRCGEVGETERKDIMGVWFAGVEETQHDTSHVKRNRAST